MRKKEGQRGVALLMVLISVVMLTAMVTDLLSDNEVELASAVNHRQSLQAEHLARSAVNLSRLLLSMQPVVDRGIKSFSVPLWKFANMILQPFSDPSKAGMFGKLTGVSLDEATGLGVDQGSFSVQIVDEDAKLNINKGFQKTQKELVARQLMAFFAPPQFDDFFGESLDEDGKVPRDVLISEIIDWTDDDEETYGFQGGVEDGYYTGLEKPYERKNAPFDSLQELHLVKGVTEDIWKTFVDPDPSKPDKRMMTIWSSGKINVNTAPPGVLLMAICLISAQAGDLMVCDPNNMGNLLAIIGIVTQMRKFGFTFKKVSDFTKLMAEPLTGVTGVSLKRGLASMYLTTSSNIFSIYAKGNVGEIEKRIHAVIDLRNQATAAGGRYIYWRMD